jgi:hypothetical protein
MVSGSSLSPRLSAPAERLAGLGVGVVEPVDEALEQDRGLVGGEVVDQHPG